MPLSITNKNHISQEEIQTLARCNLNTHLIAIQTNAANGPKIITLAKSEVSCWQLFLRNFGAGNLVHFQVHLSDVVSHLNRYNWAEGANLSSDYHLAYLKTCTLANKALYSRGNETLADNVATVTLEKKMEFVQYRGTQVLNRHAAVHSFRLNPNMQVKHIEAVIRKHFPNTQVRIENANFKRISGDVNVSRELLNTAKIYIEQRLEESKPTPSAKPKKAPKPSLQKA
jgi:hypothetical protein